MVVLVGACAKDRSDLARRPRSTAGGAGGSNGVSAGGAAGLAGGAGGSAAGAGPSEPPGPPVVTLLHGVVDAPRVAFCFARHVDGAPAPSGSPVPVGGLPFGGVVTLGSLPGVDVAREDATLYVVAGAAELLSSLDCAAALERAAALAGGEGGAGGALARASGGAGGAGAGSSPVGDVGGAPPGASPPPGLRARSLVTIPGGTLEFERSTWLVARGCLGGSVTPNADRTGICDASVGADAATLAPVFARLSRITTAGSVGVMAVHAATPVAPDERLSVGLVGPETGWLAIASDLRPGAVAPAVPRFLTEVAWQTRVPAGVVSVVAQRTPPGEVEVPWGELGERAGEGLPEAGETAVLVVVGPGLGVDTEGGGWNPPAVVLVDPSRAPD